MTHPSKPSRHEIPADTRVAADCVCVFSCADDEDLGCWRSGTWHVHENRFEGDVFGPCPVHPGAAMT